jgi:hypothetical protein
MYKWDVGSRARVTAFCTAHVFLEESASIDPCHHEGFVHHKSSFYTWPVG